MAIVVVGRIGEDITNQLMGPPTLISAFAGSARSRTVTLLIGTSHTLEVFPPGCRHSIKYRQTGPLVSIDSLHAQDALYALGRISPGACEFWTLPPVVEGLTLEMAGEALRHKTVAVRSFPAWLVRARDYLRGPFIDQIKLAVVAEKAMSIRLPRSRVSATF